MNIKNILSEKNKDLHYVAESNKKNYLNSKPFPSIVFKNFFNNEYLNKILDDFPHT